MRTNGLHQIKVLLAVPTTPPFSGPEINGQMLLAAGLGPQFHLLHLRTNSKEKNQEKGKLDFSSYFLGLRLWIRMIWIMLTFRPQAVYLNLSQNLTGFLRDSILILTAWVCQAKVVAHVRGSNFRNFYVHSSPLFQKLIRSVLGCLTCVIVLADRLRSQFTGLVPAERVQIVYNGVDESLFAPRRNKSSDNLTILFLGHLSKAKGFDDLLQCAPRVLDAVPESRFIFAGEWLEVETNILFDESGSRVLSDNQSMQTRWSNLHQEYGERLYYAGVLSGERKLEVLTSADIFVLPSYSEGFPMSVLEAMSVGMPLVVTPVGALPEILQSGINALFVSPGDINSLADSLIALASDSNRRQQMGLANRKKVMESFTFSLFREKLAAILTGCL